MKSSVSLSLGAGKAKAVTKRIHDEEEAQDVRHVSEFRSGDAPGEQEGAKRKARKVIPCKPNKLTTKKDAGDVGALKDRFENAAVQKEAPKEYGLVAARQAGQQQQGARAQQPNATTSTSRATWQSQAAALPEAPHADAYDDMPVEDFGLALLRGMGMKQEDNVATVQYIARPSRMGLGAKPGDMATGKRSYKELVGADGGAKSVVRAGDAVIDTATLGARVGKRMVVAAGRHEGLECVVRKLDAGGQEGSVEVRLLPSEQDVVLAEEQLTEPGQIGHRGAKDFVSARDKNGRHVRQEGAPSNGRGQDHDRRQGGDDGARGADAQPSSRRDPSSAEGNRPRARASWLREGIRVRVVDKGVAKGRLYLKKALVVTVTAPGQCDVQMDDGSVREGLTEDQLETVVSKKPQAALMILRGKLAGRHARLLRKERDNAVVELTESRDVATVSLDDVADYSGAMEGEDF